MVLHNSMAMLSGNFAADPWEALLLDWIDGDDIVIFGVCPRLTLCRCGSHIVRPRSSVFCGQMHFEPSWLSAADTSRGLLPVGNDWIHLPLSRMVMSMRFAHPGY